MVFTGAVVGMISFLLRPPSQNDIALRVDFTAMQLTTVEHSFLFLFTILTYCKLELSDIFRDSLELHWIVVFSPLFTLSVASIGLVVWAIRRDKSFEFELFFAINIVQLFFLAFKLDDLVDWSWAVVFIPLWVVLSLSAVGVLYALVLSIVLARSRHLVPSHRRQHITSALFHACLVVPALICMVLLTGKLDYSEWSDHDSTSDMPFTVGLPFFKFDGWCIGSFTLISAFCHARKKGDEGRITVGAEGGSKSRLWSDMNVSRHLYGAMVASEDFGRGMVKLAMENSC
ncbi:hypothetical protein KIN20_029739 [Parelaphostrongylus tenuis]|uniref:Uncharacterized protein n=1 Tax=Parelaphostrongylus tenuis TaxID=148309 RepID=A0AAD5R308_PARTN|nr:hypothetical protein KIN20_029739 [Parelaphostrongylus tenuis]